MSPRRSRQLLEALQQRLSDVGIQSFFSAADDHILLDVHAASETVTVQVAEPDEGRGVLCVARPGRRVPQGASGPDAGVAAGLCDATGNKRGHDPHGALNSAPVAPS